MPDETRNYLPKLQAVKNIIRDPGKYGLKIDDIPDAPYFAVVKTTRRMDVKRAAELAEMPLDEFEMLNPQHNRPVIAGADEYTILLPIDKAELFAAKLELTQPAAGVVAGVPDARATRRWRRWRRATACRIETLRAVNGIGARTRVPAGHALLVPAERPTEASALSLSQTVFTTVPQGRTMYYQVRRGDTMSSIATRNHVSVGELRGWNNLVQNKVVAGQRLRIVSESPAGPPAHHGTGARTVARTPPQHTPATPKTVSSRKPAVHAKQHSSTHKLAGDAARKAGTSQAGKTAATAGTAHAGKSSTAGAAPSAKSVSQAGANAGG